MKRSLLFFALLLLPLTIQAQQPVEIARSYRERHGAEILQAFAEFLSIPNVAGDSVHIYQNARWIQQAFEARGIHMELLHVPGAPPIVFGEKRVPGATRTFTFYAHYDGQPVDSSQWTHPPYTPTLYNRSMEEGGVPIAFPPPGAPIDSEWRIYARSAGDDKAPIMALLTALDALHEAGLEPTVNIKLFFEGEEEAGSPHLSEYLYTFRNQLATDLWLFCDGPVHQSRRPQLVFGVRGITGLDITVYGAKRYLHSGHYGNWAPNPGFMLAHLLASMKDAQGNVLVKGYYDDVLPLTEEERIALKTIPPVDDRLKQELGLAWTEGAPASLVERLMLPSLNIRGLASGTVGKTARNIIPPTAEVSLDMRLVPGNDPEKMKDLVEAHIRRQGFYIVRTEPTDSMRLRYPRIVRVIRRKGYPAARTSMRLPIVRALIQHVQNLVGEDQLVLMPMLGGSLPLYLFTDKLHHPVIITPIANHDNNQHAPDENLRIANLWYGIDLFTTLLRF